MSLPSPKKMDCDAIKRSAFHDDRILVVGLDNPALTWPDRQLLEQLGERLYGKPPKARPELRMVRNGPRRSE